MWVNKFTFLGVESFTRTDQTRQLLTISSPLIWEISSISSTLIREISSIQNLYSVASGSGCPPVIKSHQRGQIIRLSLSRINCSCKLLVGGHIRKTDFKPRFGGTNGIQCSNELWMYDPKSNIWIQQHVIGNVPCPREGHAATVVDDVMYVFGGRDQRGRCLDDLAALRMQDCQWRVLTVKGPSPLSRAGHTLTAVRQQITLTGGLQNVGSPHNADLEFIYTLDVRRLEPPWESSSSAIRSLIGSKTPFYKFKQIGSEISDIRTSSHSAFSMNTDITSIRDVRTHVFFYGVQICLPDSLSLIVDWQE